MKEKMKTSALLTAILLTIRLVHVKGIAFFKIRLAFPLLSGMSTVMI